MVTKAQLRASAKYQAEQIKTIGLRFHTVRDADILEWLEGKTNKTDYFRELVRKDMNK